MLAGQFPSPRKVQLVDVPEPTLKDAAGESIIFQPEVTCLCGSDLPFFDGDFEGHSISYPQPPGMSLHEMVGTVIASNGQKWQAGDRVLAVPENQHGFFERFVMSEHRAIALDDRIKPEEALMAQPFGTVLWALQKLPNMIGQDVAVVGLGPIGQMFVIALRNLGARRIVGIDPIESRCEAALQLGAHATICQAAESCLEPLNDACSGQLPRFVIEAVGHKAQAFDACIQLCRSEGTLLYFGVPPVPVPSVDLRAAMMKNITVLTSLHPDFEHTFPLAMQWIAEGRVNLKPLITHSFELSQIQTAFDVFRGRKEGALKVIVRFPAAESPA